MTHCNCDVCKCDVKVCKDFVKMKCKIGKTEGKITVYLNRDTMDPQAYVISSKAPRQILHLVVAYVFQYLHMTSDTRACADIVNYIFSKVENFYKIGIIFFILIMIS